MWTILEILSWQKMKRTGILSLILLKQNFKSKPPSCKSSCFTQTILSITHVLRHKTHVQFESFVILSTTHQPVPSALYIYLEFSHFSSPLMLPHCASDHLTQQYPQLSLIPIFPASLHTILYMPARVVI